MAQARRHGGVFRGRAPPNDCLCPPKRKLCLPKRGLCPEEINRLGATGVQIEAENWCLPPVFLLFLWTRTGLHKTFGTKTFCFWSSLKNSWNIARILRR